MALPRIHSSSRNRDLNRVPTISNSFSHGRGLSRHSHTAIPGPNRPERFPERYYIALFSVPVLPRKSHKPLESQGANKTTQFVAGEPVYSSE